jgi:hypothetical protein
MALIGETLRSECLRRRRTLSKSPPDEIGMHMLEAIEDDQVGACRGMLA